MSDEVQQKTPLEVVDETIVELMKLTDSSAVMSAAIFEALKDNGYVIARARVQWRH